MNRTLIEIMGFRLKQIIIYLKFTKNNKNISMQYYALLCDAYVQ